MRLLAIGSVTVLLITLGGCSIDRLHPIDHPSSAQPGDTITVTLANYFVLATMPTIHGEFTRDSVHFAMGLPAGWSVAAMDYYVADGMRLNTIELPTDPATGAVDTAALSALFRDSLEVYDQRRQAMSADQGLADFMQAQHMTITLDTLGTTMTLDGDSVGQWLGYGAVAGIAISEPDTLISLSDTSSVWSQYVSADSLDQSSQFGVDSVGLSAIPVFVQARLVVGEMVGSHTLIYYCKTGPLPEDLAPADSGEMSDWVMSAAAGYLFGQDPQNPPPIDKGGTSVVSFVVAGPGAAGPRAMLGGGYGGMHARVDPRGHLLHIDYHGTAAPGAYIAVYNPTGKRLARLHPAVRAGGWSATWELKRRPAGTYLVRAANATLPAQTIRLVK
jgi:hypothetical protein